MCVYNLPLKHHLLTCHVIFCYHCYQMARRESFFGRSGSGMLEPPVSSKQRRNSLSFPFFNPAPKVVNEEIAKAQDDVNSVSQAIFWAKTYICLASIIALYFFNFLSI